MAGAPAGYDVFLSYSRADQDAANQIRDRLVEDGKLKVFIDWRAFLAGRSWQPALEAALAGCRAIVVLIGPKGIRGWQHREIQLGLDRQTGAEKTATPFPVIPVLLPGLESDDYPLGTFLALNTWVAFEQSVNEPGPLQRLLAAVHGQPINRPPRLRLPATLSRPPRLPRAGRRPVLRPRALRRRAGRQGSPALGGERRRRPRPLRQRRPGRDR